MLAQDANFRNSVKAVAATMVRADIKDPALQDQPVPSALTKIDQLFRAKGLNLCVYDLAEVNRWMVVDNKAGGKGSPLLDQYFQAIQPVFATIPAHQQQDFLEAVAVALVDPAIRGQF